MSNEYYQPPMSAHMVETELHFGKLFLALWRSKLMIGAVVLSALVATFVLVSLMTPSYKSATKMIIENHESVYTRPTAGPNGFSFEASRAIDPETVASQTQIILSRDLLREVVYALKLNELSEFNPTLKGISGLVMHIKRFLNLHNEAHMTNKEDAIIANLNKKLEVYNIEKSRVIAIEAKSYDSDLASLMANTLALKYIESQRTAERETTSVAAQWLASEIEELRGKVKIAEDRVHAYKRDSNIFRNKDNQNIALQGLTELSTQLTTAKAEQAELKARSQMINLMLKNNQPLETSDVLNSQVIQRLTEQRGNVRATIAQQSTVYAGGHPVLKRLSAQLANIDSQIKLEAQKIARGLENDALIAQARVDAIEHSIKDQEKNVTASNTKEVELNDLEREAKTARDQLESLLTRYQDAIARQNLETLPIQARVIARAAPSSKPFSPNKGLALTVTGILSLILCVVFVFAREIMNGNAFVTHHIPLYNPMQHMALTDQRGGYGYGHSTHTRPM